MMRKSQGIVPIPINLPEFMCVTEPNLKTPIPIPAKVRFFIFNFNFALSTSNKINKYNIKRIRYMFLTLKFLTFKPDERK